MKSYLDFWVKAATTLFAQALTGEPRLEEGLPKPMAPGSLSFTATVGGERQGRLVVMLDGALLEAPLLGAGADQRAGWAEILREVAEAAVGEMLASAGIHCRVESFAETPGESKITRAFELMAGERRFPILVRDEVKEPAAEAAGARRAQGAQAAAGAASGQASTGQVHTGQASTGQSSGGQAGPNHSGPNQAGPSQARTDTALTALSAGVELLLDVELEASLRFGCREMPLVEILDLGPGDVVELDRHVSEPVDLIVGDKIVARGEVVLVKGSFGLRVTEVAEPRKRLESIRCLF